MEETKVSSKRDIKRINEHKKVILYFFVYAISGWLLETIFCILTTGQFDKRGFLYGPLCPMYGYAAVAIIQLLKDVKTNTIGKFCICMIAFTIFEYVVAVVLESLFGLRWWDYSNEKFNFQGRISLPYSVAWGIIGVIFVEKLHPYIKSKIDKYTKTISTNIQDIVLVIIVSIYVIDSILSILRYAVQ